MSRYLIEKPEQGNGAWLSAAALARRGIGTHEVLQRQGGCRLYEGSWLWGGFCLGSLRL